MPKGTDPVVLKVLDPVEVYVGRLEVAHVGQSSPTNHKSELPVSSKTSYSFGGVPIETLV